jgi:hypothetical protein
MSQRIECSVVVPSNEKLITSRISGVDVSSGNRAGSGQGNWR